MKELMIEAAKILLAVALIAALFVLGKKVGAYIQSGADKIPDSISDPGIKVTMVLQDTDLA